MKTAEEPGDALRKSPPANEECGAVANGAGTLTRPQPGWDPFEVWRSRVKRPSTPDCAAQTGDARSQDFF